jgi:hypothetical protein
VVDTASVPPPSFGMFTRGGFTVRYWYWSPGMPGAPCRRVRM